MPAIIRVVDGRTIIKMGENTALASKYATLAEQFANAAGVSADAVEIAAAAVGVYTTVGAGESATTNGQSFYVASGGDVTLYINNAGTGDEVASLATASDVAARPTFTELASTAPGEGAALVGLPQGGVLTDAIRYVTPQMFGAKGDWDVGTSTGTDDTLAFQNAINAAQALGWGLNIPHGKYRTTGPLVSDEVITIFSDGGHIFYDTNDPGVALTISPGVSGSLLSRPRVLGHLVVEKVTRDWSVECHGVKIENCYMGEFHISVIKFNRGIWLHGNETGCVYNDVHISQLTNNKYSTYLSTETALGWTNQNTFWGGRYSNGVNEVGSHTFVDDSLYGPNGNCWMRPSLEAVGPSFELFNLQGSQNSILYARFEHAAVPTFYGELGGTKNEIEAHASPFLTEGRVNITGTLCRLVTSVGSRSRQQGDYTLERQGAGPVLSVRNISGGGGLEVQTAAGARAVFITANDAWEVFNGKKVHWRSNAAPTTGTWTRGDIAWMTSPSGGTQAGWICTATGTPGTWQPFGLIGGTRAASVDYAAGAEPTKAEFDALIDALKTAGLMA